MAKTIIEYETVEQGMVSIDLTQVHAIENRTGAMGVFVYTPTEKFCLDRKHKYVQVLNDWKQSKVTENRRRQGS
jgi:hypothetical protein